MTVEIAAAALESMRAAVDVLPRRRDQLLPALLAAEYDLGWLPEPAIEHVATHIRVPVSEVYATATAYSELRLESPVPGRWGVCTGVTCREAGADALIAALGDRATAVDCRFACALAPVAEDDRGALLGRCTVARLDERAGSGAPP